ncbi:FixH family protein [Sporosarcina sp. PTS2304]|uniref:FixH family protein n=1 Tax=Sporosarcina sp. PTS2304 TaxID=2283194 RepID=UPI0013B46B8D|nr:FixH family protein [Sporosarcina sp. PTS2304]
MRKISLIMTFVVFLLVGCNSSSIDIQVEQAPIYSGETPSELVLKITKDEEAVDGLEVTADLEMAKMDHGHIKVELTEQGNGMYTGEVVLPMGGEWIADVKATSNDDETEQIITFDVEER